MNVCTLKRYCKYSIKLPRGGGGLFISSRFEGGGGGGGFNRDGGLIFV